MIPAQINPNSDAGQWIVLVPTMYIFKVPNGEIGSELLGTVWLVPKACQDSHMEFHVLDLEIQEQYRHLPYHFCMHNSHLSMECACQSLLLCTLKPKYSAMFPQK